MSNITHSNDAGRYGGSRPSDVVKQFAALAWQGHAVDQFDTDQGVLVQLTYNPTTMDANERMQLIFDLYSFVLSQESWHGDWFLWNLVTVSDSGGTGQDIRLSIG